MSKKSVLFASSLLLSSVALASASSLDFNQIIAFGDSLSDTGNAAIASGGQYPGPNYAPGRFTNGPNTTPATAGPQGVWVEQLAAKLGVTDPQPNLAAGTNFSFGGADTGASQLFGVTNQVNAFSLVNLGSAPSNSLYTFWAGANDIADGKDPVTAADNIYNNILTVSAEGGKHFLWVNLPPLGNTPKVLAQDQVNPLATVFVNQQAGAFNQEWQLDIYKLMQGGIDVTGVNVSGLFYQIGADNQAGCTVSAADPYCFANITSPAQGQSVDPNTYLFWDQEHPTTAGHALVADLAFADLQAAPEPTSMALAIGGLLVLAGLRRHKNKR